MWRQATQRLAPQVAVAAAATRRCLHAGTNSGAASGAGAAAVPVRLIGDAALRDGAEAVPSVHDAVVARDRAALHATLAAFRARHGFGRAIAAPQIGARWRMIALDLGGGSAPFTMHNPVLLAPSADTFTMWDDCMSFPDYLVRVRRHDSVGVRYTDEGGREVTRHGLPRALSELLQHEVDHLDGVTSFDRAEGRGAVIHRAVYDAHRASFDAQVDYAIVPTL